MISDRQPNKIETSIPVLGGTVLQDLDHPCTKASVSTTMQSVMTPSFPLNPSQQSFIFSFILSIFKVMAIGNGLILHGLSGFNNDNNAFNNDFDLDCELECDILPSQAKSTIIERYLLCVPKFYSSISGAGLCKLDIVQDHTPAPTFSSAPTSAGFHVNSEFTLHALSLALAVTIIAVKDLNHIEFRGSSSSSSSDSSSGSCS